MSTANNTQAQTQAKKYLSITVTEIEFAELLELGSEGQREKILTVPNIDREEAQAHAVECARILRDAQTEARRRDTERTRLRRAGVSPEEMADTAKQRGVHPTVDRVNLRTRTVKVALSRREFETVQKRAAEYALSTSDFVRLMLLSETICEYLNHRSPASNHHTAMEILRSASKPAAC